MPPTSRTESLKIVVGNEQSAEQRSGATESVNFPPVASVCRPFDEEVKEDIADLVTNVPAIDDYFNIVEKIGAGTFSSVYLAEAKNCGRSRQQYALKHLIPTSHPSRIENELHCLKDLGGQANVIAVQSCVRHNDHIVIIMPYFEHDRFQDYVRDMSVGEIRVYMQALLTAVAHVHSCRIIHRDIKHSNFLYNRRLKQFALVDFGLAQRLIKAESTEHQPEVSDTTSQLNAHNSLIAKQSSVSSKADVVTDENLETPATHQTHTSCEANPLKTEDEKSSRGMLRTLNVSLTSLSVDCDLTMKTESGVGVGRVSTESPLRRKLLTRRALNVGCRQSHGGGDSTVISKSKRHAAASKTSSSTCRCFGRPMVCSFCLTRPTEKAPRAGTPGYRAPEVLMKYPNQTTAVDVWSVGVIFLSLLAGHYPIFKASDDMEALSQIICVFGSEELKNAAQSYGKQLDCRPVSTAVDLKQLCCSLRQRAQCATRSDDIPNCAFDLLHRLLDLNPFNRITADDALKHPFIDPCAQ